MNINITVIFQAINFLIAYLLLRFLLFKPAYTVIKKEKRKEDNLLDAIAHQRAIITNKEQDIKERWQECQEYFQKNKPPIDTQELHIFKHIAPQLEQSSITQETVTNLIQEVKQELINRVGS